MLVENSQETSKNLGILYKMEKATIAPTPNLAFP